jgi:hypothetical protein
LSSGVGLCIAFQPLNGLKANRLSTRSLGFVGERDLLAAGAVPALIFAQHKRDNSMAAVLVPFELTAQGTRDEVGYGQRQPIHVHVRAWAAVLILPDARLEGRQMLVRPSPVALQGRRLMSDKPEGANA